MNSYFNLYYKFKKNKLWSSYTIVNNRFLFLITCCLENQEITEINIIFISQPLCVNLCTPVTNNGWLPMVSLEKNHFLCAKQHGCRDKKSLGFPSEWLAQCPP